MDMQFYEEQAKLNTKRYFNKDFKVNFISDFGKNAYIDFMVKHYPYERFQYSIEVVEHCIKRYKTRSELQRRDFKLYTYAFEYRLIDKHLPLTKAKATVDSIKEAAKQCMSKSEFAKKYQYLYNKARSFGMIDELEFDNLESACIRILQEYGTLSVLEIREELLKYLDDPLKTGEF